MMSCLLKDICQVSDWFREYTKNYRSSQKALETSTSILKRLEGFRNFYKTVETYRTFQNSFQRKLQCGSMNLNFARLVQLHNCTYMFRLYNRTFVHCVHLNFSCMTHFIHEGTLGRKNIPQANFSGIYKLPFYLSGSSLIDIFL